MDEESHEEKGEEGGDLKEIKRRKEHWSLCRTRSLAKSESEERSLRALSAHGLSVSLSSIHCQPSPSHPSS